MTEEEKGSIIASGKECFRTVIIPNHIKNLKKLTLKEFNINPFLINYVAAFLCGDTSPKSLAKALIYPRILGTSLNTTFGMSIQIFISSLKEIVGNASGINGIDIEFVDAIDGRRKYCQCKAGPNTINQPDVATILGHFKGLMNKSRLDRMGLQFEDLIVGVLYGEKSELSNNYKSIDAHYPVLCGKDFWEHLTGDKDFYNKLSKAFGEVVEEENINGSQLILEQVDKLAQEIIDKGGL